MMACNPRKHVGLVKIMQTKINAKTKAFDRVCSLVSNILEVKEPVLVPFAEQARPERSNRIRERNILIPELALAA